MLLHRRFVLLVRDRPLAALLLYRSLLLANAGYFGLLTGASLVWAPLSPVRQTLTLVAIVVGSAATVALSLDPWARYGIPIVVGGPLWMGFSAHARSDEWPVVVLAVVLYVYLLVTSRPVQDDYWNAAQAQALLSRRAAELEQLSLTDPLTQIANRLAFDRRLGEEWGRAAREREPLSLLIIDVDHFKALNDDFGHLVGDRCLVAMAATLKVNVYRSVDLVARYGGEEFVVLLPDTSSHAAAQVGERLRAAVAALVVDHEGVSVRFTCSVGVTTTVPKREGSLPSEALQAADQALYRAKAAGRNRVVAAPAAAPAR
jgi:diguanylate cyclase (GGDEF)-like protein